METRDAVGKPSYRVGVILTTLKCGLMVPAKLLQFLTLVCNVYHHLGFPVGIDRYKIRLSGIRSDDH